MIALDTPLDPIDAADATLATDNFKAGELIGAWAKATARRRGGGRQDRLSSTSARSQPTVDVLRDQGFMQGFGIDLGDPEADRRRERRRATSCHDVTNGNPEGGRKAMENCLQKDPDINVVYTINEPAAAGAFEALKAAGKESDVLIVSIDGGCPGVQGRRGRASSAPPRSSIRC